MKSVNSILQTDFCIEQERVELPEARDWPRWLLAHSYDPDAIPVLSAHAETLQARGVDLTNPDLPDVVWGHLSGLEDAILVVLAKQDLEKPTAYLMAALRGNWKSKGKSQPYLPVRTAVDFAPPLVPPTPAPRRSIPQLQADLDAGGARAIATTAAIRHNPQWGLDVVEGRIKARIVEDSVSDDEENVFELAF